MRLPQPGSPQPAGRAAPAGTTPRHTIDLTNAWQPPDSGGPTCWSRSFGRPRELDPGERIWLVLDAGRACRLTLNGSPLATASGPRGRTADITGLLEPRNRLLLLPAEGEAPLPPDSPGVEGSGGLRGSVAAHGRCPLPAAYGRIRLEFAARTAGPPSDETPSGA